MLQTDAAAVRPAGMAAVAAVAAAAAPCLYVVQESAIGLFMQSGAPQVQGAGHSNGEARRHGGDSSSSIHHGQPSCCCCKARPDVTVRQSTTPLVKVLQRVLQLGLGISPKPLRIPGEVDQKMNDRWSGPCRDDKEKRRLWGANGVHRREPDETPEEAAALERREALPRKGRKIQFFYGRCFKVRGEGGRGSQEWRSLSLVSRLRRWLLGEGHNR